MKEKDLPEWERKEKLAARIGECCRCEDKQTADQIINTLLEAPLDVFRYVVNHCYIFVMNKGCHGITVYPQPIKDRWVIFLSTDLPSDDAKRIILHEIAHAWLKHKFNDPYTEKKAEEQAQTWMYGY